MLAISPMVTGSQFINLSGDDMTFNVTFVTGTATIEAVGYAVSVWQGSTTGTINVQWEKIPADITGTSGLWGMWWTGAHNYWLTEIGGSVGDYQQTVPLKNLESCLWPNCFLDPESWFYVSGSSFFVNHTFKVPETGYYSITFGQNIWLTATGGLDRIHYTYTNSITLVGQTFSTTGESDHVATARAFPIIDIPKVLLNKNNSYDIVFDVEITIIDSDDPPWDIEWYIDLGTYPSYLCRLDVKGWEG